MRRATRPTTSQATAPSPQLVIAFLTAAPSPVNCLTPAVRLKTPRSAQSAALRTASTSALRVLASSTTSTAPSSRAVAARRHANQTISPSSVRRRLMAAPVRLAARRAPGRRSGEWPGAAPDSALAAARSAGSAGGAVVGAEVDAVAGAGLDVVAGVLAGVVAGVGSGVGVVVVGLAGLVIEGSP